ncbi:hypothetical protein ABEV55_06770 [Aneurinibacillus thermoaerophilus]|uniref:hypothetical protein n=1 Tax=Aneurinibacillus TaxID=55079 RepID=UPI00070CC356|nr:MULTISPECIES: hypothetical protein [Aneurinibacillus]AMA72734.1 hypothetical protein ACH33_07630 [Aneurinibacillus sp. XH2]MED0674543.1 hypothetical protein [Aneurinibacillus thermoaerophilus]
MLVEKTLRNIPKTEYRAFFKAHGITKLNKRLQTSSAADYRPILTVIREELQNPNNRFTAEAFDEFLFNKLFYENNNYYYVYCYDDFFADEETPVPDIEKYLQQQPSLLFNQLLTDNEDIRDFQLCTTRIETKNGKFNELKLLIKVCDSSPRKGVVHLYAAITVNVEFKFVIIKFNLNYLDSCHSEKLKIVSDLKKVLTSSSTYRPLQLNIASLNEDGAKETIFKLFEELSLEAEKRLEEKIAPGTDQKIENFLRSLNFHEVKKDYVQQIKAVIYQDISDTFKEEIFPNGWVFKFMFREGDCTRASSRTEDYTPVYSSKVYWHLKELIFKKQRLEEAGFIWHINQNNQKIVFIRIESKNDSLIIQYYRNYNDNRKEKEEFVLRKINTHLPRD